MPQPAHPNMAGYSSGPIDDHSLPHAKDVRGSACYQAAK
jgi:hypothetical protein